MVIRNHAMYTHMDVIHLLVFADCSKGHPQILCCLRIWTGNRRAGCWMPCLQAVQLGQNLAVLPIKHQLKHELAFITHQVSPKWGLQLCKVKQPNVVLRRLINARVSSTEEDEPGSQKWHWAGRLSFRIEAAGEVSMRRFFFGGGGGMEHDWEGRQGPAFSASDASEW